MCKVNIQGTGISEILHRVYVQFSLLSTDLNNILTPQNLCFPQNNRKITEVAQTAIGNTLEICHVYSQGQHPH